MARTPSTFGNINVLEVIKRFPAVSSSKAIEIARETGQSISDPATIREIMKSRTFQERITEAANGERRTERRETRQLERLSGRTLPEPTFAQAPGEQLETAFRAQAGSFAREAKTQEILFTKQIRISADLREAEFHRDLFKRQRRQEMDPVGNIDELIFDLRGKALVSHAQLAEQITDLSPAARQRILAERMELFTGEIKRLERFRETRIAAVDEIIDREIEARDERITGLESQADILEETLEIAKARGVSERNFAGVFEELAKIRKKEEKEKSGGLTTLAQIIFERLKREHTDAGRALGSDIRRILKAQAMELAEFQKRIGKDPRELQGLRGVPGAGIPQSIAEEKSAIQLIINKESLGIRLTPAEKLIKNPESTKGPGLFKRGVLATGKFLENQPPVRIR